MLFYFQNQQNPVQYIYVPQQGSKGVWNYMKNSNTSKQNI